MVNAPPPDQPQPPMADPVQPEQPPPPTDRPPRVEPEQPAKRPPLPRRKPRLGDAALRIEPTAGPVGTTVTIYGDFRRAMRTGKVLVSFQGVRKGVEPVYIAADRVAAVVPEGAGSGQVRVRMRNAALWTGAFSVIAADDGWIEPTPVGEGLLGAIYSLPENTQALPDFATLGVPFATIVVPDLNVAPRRFEQGFPGVEEAAGKSIDEWFAIRFMGMIEVPNDGRYEFQLNSDDGARLYIDGDLVVDNDGVHAPRAKQGAIALSAGKHELTVEYFQGPRYEIALELSWRRTGAGEFATVPAGALSRFMTDFDCAEKPFLACCRANTPECLACRDQSEAQIAQWELVCEPDASPEVDCSQPPQRMCCQAQTEGCMSCRTQAAAELAAWQQECKQ
ncbi:PA14 domain-containing protein [Haliangium ochraceum]|uniref:PA14 domain-containing protein n=1 Tax=Haliangium ochraceum TaxID=80816 RepID=UPI001269C5DE|nr:PA14 domain-containing protein [Haliangium ochraceum]